MWSEVLYKWMNLITIETQAMPSNYVQVNSQIEEQKNRTHSSSVQPEKKILKILEQSTANMIPFKISRIWNLGWFKWKFNIFNVIRSKEKWEHLTQLLNSISIKKVEEIKNVEENLEEEQAKLVDWIVSFFDLKIDMVNNYWN